jgi:hypothetical protein
MNQDVQHSTIRTAQKKTQGEEVMLQASRDAK